MDEREDELEMGFNDLLQRAQDGDREAMTDLLEKIRPHVDRVAARYVDKQDPTESVSDLVQESWLRAWDKLGKFSGGETDQDTRVMFLAWAGQIVRNIGLQARRDRERLKRRPPGKRIRLRAGAGSTDFRASVEPPADDPTASAKLRGKEEAARVREAVSAIEDPATRDVVRLRFFEGLTFRQIAERCHLSYDQVRDRFHRGMALVDEQLR